MSGGASMLPAGVVALVDHEARARSALDPAAWAYLDSVAGDGITRRANRSAWNALQLWPRVLAPLQGLSTRVQLGATALAHPILVAPVAHQRLLHPDGELATAVAASAQEAGFVLSTLSNVPLETVAQAVRGDAGRGPLWFQLYLQDDRSRSLELVRRAEAAGYEGLVLTVDAPVNGVRDAERRAGFRLPAGIAAVHLAPPASADTSMAALAARAPTWSDVEWLASQTALPLWIKGVLHPADAVRAQSLGAAGLVVSNHGGRTLDAAPATAEALPWIADATGGSLPLLVDGGIRRGTDVLKALALGASAVLVGRPVAWGLASAGPLGVAHVLRLLRDELEAAMVLCGLSSLQDLPGDLLRPQPPFR